MEAIILFSAIADHEEKTVSCKNSLHVFANHRNEITPIVGMRLLLCIYMYISEKIAIGSINQIENNQFDIDKVICNDLSDKMQCEKRSCRHVFRSPLFAE